MFFNRPYCSDAQSGRPRVVGIQRDEFIPTETPSAPASTQEPRGPQGEPSGFPWHGGRPGPRSPTSGVALCPVPSPCCVWLRVSRLCAVPSCDCVTAVLSPLDGLSGGFQFGAGP